MIAMADQTDAEPEAVVDDYEDAFPCPNCGATELDQETVQWEV
jgi:hypothetical protein